MMEKIEWYKEVLELEPNSKVFFALAKLLVENDDSAQAIEVLKRGLERHPDFMEARLFLIELMYRNGLAEDCSLQVQQLSKLFASYAGFWQAWAACLSTSPGEADTASIIRFLAAHFLVGPLQINEVLNLGLAEIVKRYENKENTASSNSADNLDKKADIKPLLNSEPAQTEQPLKNDFNNEDALISEEPVIKENIDTEKSSAEIMPESVGAAINLETLPPLDVENIDKLESAENEYQEQTGPISVEAAVIPAQENEEENELMTEENSILDDSPDNLTSGDESFSIRTRSMAEVLADQGDYKGALEIYDELAKNEKDPDELKNLNKRIEELNGIVNTKVLPEDEPIQMEPPSQKKERLLGILEALAKRVEARMHN